VSVVQGNNGRTYQLRDAPADFAEKAAGFTYRGAMSHWQATGRTVHRWYAEAGIAPGKRKVDGAPARPVPADFASNAHLTQAALTALYRTSNAAVRRWRRETGLQVVQSKPRSLAPKPATTTTKPTRWKVPTAAPVSGRDMSQVGLAAEELRRRGYVPVCRAKTIDPKANADEWVVGRRRISSSAVVALVQRVAA